LQSPDFATELEADLAQRMETCAEAPAALEQTGDSHLLPLARYWEQHLTDLRDLFHRLDGDLAGAFRRLEERGRLELISSGATHGFLPLLSRDESIRLQLKLGRAEHRRIFGRDPEGLWLPECAYRPRGPWAPLPEAPGRGTRSGIEEHVEDAGYRYFFVDSHLAEAGAAFGLYGADWGEWRPELEATVARRLHGAAAAAARGLVATNSPYHAYRVAGDWGPPGGSALIRDPVASRQGWSGLEGYPGDAWYLDSTRSAGQAASNTGVSAPGSDLGRTL
jgi:1,4-alpha-glucan branching enzyme